MNCKQGDLAVIVRSYAGNEGKIVRCLKAKTFRFWLPGNYSEVLPGWFVDRALQSYDGSPTSMVPDKNLRPLRDNDGEDEMLRIAGLPNKENANA